MIIGGIIGQFEYVKRKFLKHEFIKDAKKAMKAHEESVSNAKSFMETELDVMQDYVVEGRIVLK